MNDKPHTHNWLTHWVWWDDEDFVTYKKCTSCGRVLT